MKYVDKDEEEWLRFQKAIKEENIVSDALVTCVISFCAAVSGIECMSLSLLKCTCYQVSEHIQEDEDDVKQVDRNVEEIDEHM